jgi:hypothetical protein
MALSFFRFASRPINTFDAGPYFLAIVLTSVSASGKGNNSSLRCSSFPMTGLPNANKQASRLSASILSFGHHRNTVKDVT